MLLPKHKLDELDSYRISISTTGQYYVMQQYMTVVTLIWKKKNIFGFNKKTTYEFDWPVLYPHAIDTDYMKYEAQDAKELRQQLDEWVKAA